MSPISPKNKLLSKVQSFGATGQTEDFESKRNLTLGDFYMPEPWPWEINPDSFRFETRDTKKDHKGSKTFRLKS